MVNNNLVGGFNPTLPLWKMMEWKSNGVKFPMEKMKMFQTTNQDMNGYTEIMSEKSHSREIN
jgi:hypothetical protein